jgi:hypothetical protein
LMTKVARHITAWGRQLSQASLNAKLQTQKSQE